MAKGDATQYRQDIANTRSRINQQGSQFQNLYNQASTGNLKDYQEIMDNYRNLLEKASSINPAETFGQERIGYGDYASGKNAIGLDPTQAGNVNEAIGHYKDFANTGGYSPQDIQNLRARAIAPTRAVYGNAQNQLERTKALSGGGLTNYAAASAKMNRDLAYGISDANVNANASIADAVQRGKLAGTAGLAQTALSQQAAQLQVDQINNQMKLAGLGGLTEVDRQILSAEITKRNQELATLEGQRNLYGTRPGLTETFGNQLNQSGNQDVDLLAAQLGGTKIPTGYQQALGNIGSTVGLLGSVGSIGSLFGHGAAGVPWWKALLGLGGGGSNPYTDSQGYDPYGNYIGHGPQDSDKNGVGYPGNYS